MGIVRTHQPLVRCLAVQPFTMSAAGDRYYPQQCSALRKGGMVLMKGHPCKVVNMSTSKTGKHGHAKVNITGVDIFTKKKYEDVVPSTHNVLVPEVDKMEYEVLDIDEDGFCSLMDGDGDIKEDLKLPGDELGEEIQQFVDDGEPCTVTVLSSVIQQGGDYNDHEQIMSVKAGGFK